MGFSGKGNFTQLENFGRFQNGNNLTARIQHYFFLKLLLLISPPFININLAYITH